MPFIPESRNELSRKALGAILTRSNLTDTHEGSVIDTLSQSMGAMAANIEQRILGVRDAFDFRNATGAELDERLSEFPPNTVTRLAATPATGSVIVSFSAALTAQLTIAAGSSFSSATNSENIYFSTSDVIAPIGATSAVLTVESSTAGTAGNIGAEQINVISEASPLIINVTNTAALTNGSDDESDAALKRRALLYLQSLSRSQPNALEYAALSFTGITERLVLASLYESHEIAGYSELYIDDGTGRLGDNVAAGIAYTGTVPPEGLTVLYHDAPAVNPVVPIQSVPVLNVSLPLNTSDYVSIPERGVIYIKEGVMVAGRTWTLGNYQVYQGAIAALQRYIEGDPNNPNQSPAWRAAGTRVRVLPPNILQLNFDIEITPQNGFDLTELQTTVRQELDDLLLGLRIGDPLFIAAMIDVVMEIEGITNVKFYVAGSTNSQAPQPLDDIYPAQNKLIRINTMNVVAVSGE